jgi:hypothetical protein
MFPVRGSILQVIALPNRPIVKKRKRKCHLDKRYSAINVSADDQGSIPGRGSNFLFPLAREDWLRGPADFRTDQYWLSYRKHNSIISGDCKVGEDVSLHACKPSEWTIL